MTISRLPDNVHSIPWQLTAKERKTATCVESPDDAMSCQRTLYLGFFFDGTRNNLHYDKPFQTHSNVARLYEAFEELPRPDEDRRYRYATYVPGVGTEFRKEIGDTGVGLHAAAGAAAGWGGEARINWALLQLQNNLHLYAFGKSLTLEHEDLALVERMSEDIALTRMQALRTSTDPDLTPKSVKDRQQRSEVSRLQSIQAIASTQWRYSNVDGRRSVLAERRAVLQDKLTPVLTGKLPRIAQIRISVFGFSRGAAEARVFVNWMRDLCDNASGPMRICGVPAKIDFLGLFDTVSSVGASQGLLELVADGHGGWAQQRDLRIPGPHTVTRCLHLVAGHEVRGSFPLDAAAGPNVEEVVYPGVHSDVGGGYLPKEQHRGLSDAAKLSQVPLCHMYRAAVAAGVPLLDLRNAPSELQEAFRVDSGLISRVNAYLVHLSGSTSVLSSTTASLVRAHYRAFLHWRRYYVDRFAQILPKAATRQDRADLAYANAELADEWKQLLAMDNAQGAWNSVWLGGYIGWLVKFSLVHAKDGLKGFFAQVGGTIGGTFARTYFDDLPSSWLAAISPSADGILQTHLLINAAERALKSKHQQWKEVQNAWNQTGLPPPAVANLLMQDVHDSRAWFKPLGDDDDVWVDKSRQKMRMLAGKSVLTEQERKDLHDYRMQLSGTADTDWAAVSEAVPPQKGGREVHLLWGYLRWRTVYEDALMDFRHLFPRWANADRMQLLRGKRELERQANQVKAASDAQNKRMQSSVSIGNMMGVGGSGPDFNQYQNWSGRQREIEVEINAVQRFLDELGPSSWWEEFQAAVIPG